MLFYTKPRLVGELSIVVYCKQAVWVCVQTGVITDILTLLLIYLYIFYAGDLKCNFKVIFFCTSGLLPALPLLLNG